MIFPPLADPDLFYQISQRRDRLLRLCITWEHDLHACPKDRSLPLWGPSHEAVKAMEAQVAIEGLHMAEDDEEDEGGLSEVEDDAMDDAGLLERLDALGLYTVGSDYEETDEGGESSPDEWEDVE